MNEFKRFEDRLTGLIESLSPSGRRRLSAELAKRLRQSQQRRVMAQKAPDGTPYAPRQQQSARKKTGRVKRKMFAKLITSRFLHTRKTSRRRLPVSLSPVRLRPVSPSLCCHVKITVSHPKTCWRWCVTPLMARTSGRWPTA